MANDRASDRELQHRDPRILRGSARRAPPDGDWRRRSAWHRERIASSVREHVASALRAMPLPAMPLRAMPLRVMPLPTIPRPDADLMTDALLDRIVEHLEDVLDERLPVAVRERVMAAVLAATSRDASAVYAPDAYTTGRPCTFGSESAPPPPPTASERAEQMVERLRERVEGAVRERVPHGLRERLRGELRHRIAEGMRAVLAEHARQRTP